MKFLKAIIDRGPIGWVRRFWSVVSTYHNNIQIMAAHIDAMEEEVKATLRYVKRATKVHVDMRLDKGVTASVIVIGKYRGRDYVRTFNLSGDSIEGLVKHLSGMQRYATMEHLDLPPQVDATVRRELRRGTPNDKDIF